MARKVVETLTCDGCAKKGEDTEATELLTLMGEEWDLCAEHAGRFVGLLREALGTTVQIAKSA